MSTSLSGKWDLLTLLGSMSNIGMDTSETRKAFEDLLSDELLLRLIEETFSKAQRIESYTNCHRYPDPEISSSGTADIGFLATDDDIRDYLLLHSTDMSASEEMRESAS